MSDAVLALAALSYNIHSCVGTDRHYRPDRVVELVRSLNCDVVGLQEVDLRARAEDREQIDFIADRLGMQAVSGPNMVDHRGHFGNALLTRLPVRSVRRTDLSVGGAEPRGMINAVLELDGLLFRAVVAHLGLGAAERREQVRRLLQVLDEGASDLPTLVMGDFNEWKPNGGALRGIDRRFGQSLAPRTFPSRFPLLPLDRIWVWPRAGLKRISVHGEAAARVASDHLPVRAEVAWDARDLPQAWKDACLKNGGIHLRQSGGQG
ncbi:MAG: endonuclease/exonuclease/phosphatase family protein [Alphaproteobacteria bacterium]|nr:endonuclease/exonuclease/phosphatase family protein [Alphaproteobacteria bacterium]